MSASEDGAGDKKCLSQEGIFAKQPSQASVKATVPPPIQLSPDRRTAVARAATLTRPTLHLPPSLVTTDSLPRQDLDSGPGSQRGMGTFTPCPQGTQTTHRCKGVVQRWVVGTWTCLTRLSPQAVSWGGRQGHSNVSLSRVLPHRPGGPAWKGWGVGGAASWVRRTQEGGFGEGPAEREVSLLIEGLG